MHIDTHIRAARLDETIGDGRASDRGGPVMRIGELAARVGVNPKTIRYYESIGLLPSPPRTDAGYRIYGEDDIDRLTFVRRAQQLELGLDEIREILALRERGERPCGYVLDVARSRLEDLDRRIADMQRARHDLHALLQRADDLPDHDNWYCHLIEHRVRIASNE